MALHVKENSLQLDYQPEDKNYDEKSYFEEEGNEKFDITSAKQMVIMINKISDELELDEYSLKKLEIFLSTELPFFAVTRRLVLSWVTKNFVY